MEASHDPQLCARHCRAAVRDRAVEVTGVNERAVKRQTNKGKSGCAWPRWTSGQEGHRKSESDSSDEANPGRGNGLNNTSASVGGRPKAHLDIYDLGRIWVPRP